MEVPRVGFVGFGEVNTPQEVIAEKCGQAIQWLKSSGLDVTHTDPVSDDPAGATVQRAIEELKRRKFDLLIACLAGWIPSHAVIRVLSEFRDVPILLWGLSGANRGGRLVTTADQAGTTALRQTMEDLGFHFAYIANFQDAPPPMSRIVNLARAAAAKRELRNSRIGMMGNRDMNLYATLYDGVSLQKELGVDVEFFEMLEMVQRAEQSDLKAISELRALIRQKWTFESPADDQMLDKGIRYYLAIRDRALERGYTAVSLIDVDGMKKLLQFPPAMVFMLLADELKVCTIPENDALGAVTQLITRALTGQIAAYLEFYEFFTDGVLMGVPDYVPSEIVDGPTRVRPSSFGGLAGGPLNISRLKTGQVTLVRLARRKNSYVLHLLSGDADCPGPWEEAGWAPPAPQLPGLRIRLRGDMEQFTQNVMGQHYILSYGDNAELYSEFCRWTGIQVLH